MSNDFDILGDIPSISTSPLDAAAYEVDIDGETPNVDEPLASEEEATEYFNSVTEDEALNFILMLHDIRAISFDRFNQLKTVLESTPSFLPKGY